MRRLVLISIIVSLSACGSKLPQSELRAVPSKSAAPAKVSADHSSTAPAARASKKAVPSVTATGGTTITPKTSSAKTLPLTVDISATCATPGQQMTAKVSTVKRAAIGLTAYYESNNEYTPDLGYLPGSANATGKFTWTWTLRPNVPLGHAVLKVVVGRDGAGGLATIPFRVAADC